MSIVVPAVAGPFSLGNVVTRATINVEPYSGRLVVTSNLPRVFAGIPLRLRNIAIAINRQSFLTNPTHCGALATESTLTGFVTPGSNTGSTQSLSSPFQVGECSKLKFKPSLTAFTGSKTSKANGASIEVKITQGAGQMNIRKVIFQLPKKLPSRLTTLREACPAATFEAGPPPGGCKTGRVGTATVTTPVLPGKLTGPAYLVSHGGEAFPDLDLILQGDGVTVVLVGHTNISNTGITTSKFETLPDAPISSAVVTSAGRPEIAAGGQRQPVHEHADRADDDRRSERADDPAEHEDLRAQLSSGDHRSQNLGDHGARQGQDPRRGAHQRQRDRPAIRDAPSEQGDHRHDQRAALAERRGNTAEIRTAAAASCASASYPSPGTSTSKAFTTVIFRS